MLQLLENRMDWLKDMIKEKSASLYIVGLYCALVLLQGMAYSEDIQPGLLEAMSEKLLFQMAENQCKIGNLESAYRAFKIAFEKREGKNHKKYTPMFSDLRIRLAEKEVSQGQKALSNDELSISEMHLKAAKAYLEPSDSKNSIGILEEGIEKKKSEIKRQFEDARIAAANNRFEEALETLARLHKHEDVLSGLKNEVKKTEKSFQEYLLQLGRDASLKRDWNQAIAFFQKALLRDPENQEAKKGMDRVEVGAKADQLADIAKQRAGEKNFIQAVRSIDLAMQTDGGAEVFRKIKEGIIAEWIAQLVEVLPRQMQDSSSFADSRDAVLSLETLQQLNPNHPAVIDNLAKGYRPFVENAIKYFEHLSATHKDGSSAATEYTLLMSIKSRDDSNQVNQQQLSDIAALFNRKRSSQVVIDVSNESPAPAQFGNALRARAVSVIDKLELPDLRVRRRDEYDANPQYDAIFGDQRVDGKRAAAFLTIHIEKYFSERNAEEVFKESKYEVRKEERANPAYEAKQTEIKQKIDDIMSGKFKLNKSDRPIYIEQIQSELASIPKTILVPVLGNYKYREVHHTQKTDIKLVAKLSGPITSESLASIEIPFSITVKGIEITGVHPNDIEAHQNRTLVMISREEALGQAERFVLDEINKSVPEMIPAYTDRFLLAGKQQLEAKQSEEAVESFLCHWAFMRGKLSAENALLIRDTVKASTAYNLEKNNQDFIRLLDSSTPSH